MTHPETQNLRVFGKENGVLGGHYDTETNDAINFYFSNLLNQEALRNLDTHYFTD
jgi:hypothetical protein